MGIDNHGIVSLVFEGYYIEEGRLPGGDPVIMPPIIISITSEVRLSLYHVYQGKNLTTKLCSSTSYLDYHKTDLSIKIL